MTTAAKLPDVRANARCLIHMRRKTVVWEGTVQLDDGSKARAVTELKPGTTRRINGVGYAGIRDFLESQPQRTALATIIDGQIQVIEGE